VDLGKIPEGQLRPLSKIKNPTQQREAWQQALDTAPDGKGTMMAALLERFNKDHEKNIKK